VAAAALYTINTDDGSVNEWGPSGQNIPVWETDPSGDEVPSDPSVDIVETKLASGIDTGEGISLNFLVRFSGSNALNTSNTGVAALLDCPQFGTSDPPNGVTTDLWDLGIVYVANGTGGLLNPESDGIYLVSGDVSVFIHEDNLVNTTLGQTAESNYAEWSITNDHLANDTSQPDEIAGAWDYDCTQNVNIKFATYDLANLAVTLLDETATLKGFNVPTAIRLQGLQASSGVREFNLAYAAIIVIFLGAAGFLLRRQLMKI